MSAMKGSLTVRIIRGVELYDTNTLGKQDPYCKMTLGKESFKTKVHKNGGKNPQWDQSFIFNVDTKDASKEIFHLTCYDKETISDDAIGRTDLPLTTMVSKQGTNMFQIVDFDDFKKSHGNIEMTITWSGTGAPQQQAPQVVQQQMQQQVQPQVIYQQPQVIHQQPVHVVPRPAVVHHQVQHHQQQSGGIAPFQLNRMVILTSAASGKTLRVMPNGSVNGQGGTGKLARFVVKPGNGPHQIRLLCNSTGKYLRITPQGQHDGLGGLGKFTLFRVKPQANGNVTLQSVALGHPQQNVNNIGVLPNGTMKAHAQTGMGLHGQFRLQFIQ